MNTGEAYNDKLYIYYMNSSSKHFVLRPWKESDLDSLVRHANHLEIARNLTDAFPHPYTRENGENFIRNAMKGRPTSIFAIEVNGEAAGGIGIHPQQDIYRKNAELGYWLSVDHHGKGIVTEAIKQMTDYAFSNFDIDRVFARPFGSNKASQRVLEKAGFKLEGRFEKTLYKNGEYLDELIYAVRRNDPHVQAK